MEFATRLCEVVPDTAALEHKVERAYKGNMSGKTIRGKVRPQPRGFTFTGKVVRTEPGGFGIVEFDKPVGPTGNTFGVVSISSGAATTGFNITELKTGARVSGTAEADDREIAAVTTISISRE